MKYLFIVNPMSGRRGADEVLVPRIREWADGRGIDYAIEVTEYPRHATEIVQEYAARHEKLRVCACGGDGTISETAAGAVGQKHVELALYPSGGGNDFVKCICEQQKFLDFDAVVDGDSVAIDMMKVGDYYCINLMSVGIDADINYGTARYRKLRALRGPMAYNLSLVEHLFKPMGKDLKVLVDDDVTLDGNYILVAAGNGQVYGGGYRATPEALLNDGLIDIVVINKMSLPNIAKVLGIYKKGSHLENGEVIDLLKDKMRFMRAQKLTIQSDREFIINIDGESVTGKAVDIAIEPRSLNLVLPPGVRYP